VSLFDQCAASITDQLFPVFAGPGQPPSFCSRGNKINKKEQNNPKNQKEKLFY
jgi:hypothetical protein